MMATGCYHQPRYTQANFGLPRYTNLQYINEGAYGMVCSAVDNHTRRRVAIKKISPFLNSNGSKALREIMILSRFKHDNIVNILDIVAAPTQQDIQDLHIVLPLMETDLRKLLKSRRLSNEHIRCFLYQILRGLRYIHSANIIHFDMKPGNVLVNSDCYLKICDFGLARIITSKLEDSYLTHCAVTRGYRAPEVMLRCKAFVSRAIDMWSVGCILAEMISNRPLFAGRHYLDELNNIINIIGSPSAEDLLTVTREDSKRHIQSLARKPKKPLAELFPQAEPVALDLLDRMITFSPHNRITVEDVLEHRFLDRYHDEMNEPVALVPFNSESEPDKLPPEEIKKMIYKETAKYSAPFVDSPY
ncbi:mitogen-activated protein kinase 1-like [Dendronephthya gigantea]|uniref:mitogen-activated protein kinase 1-like n=1 Tax=Dendronephthya gigantea TaxID=151771 RepID=UPI00106C04DE|nr:mitogen-activated protein kinase 1-like [Dendronephthya gigantea]